MVSWAAGSSFLLEFNTVLDSNPLEGRVSFRLKRLSFRWNSAFSFKLNPSFYLIFSLFFFERFKS